MCPPRPRLLSACATTFKATLRDTRRLNAPHDGLLTAHGAYKLTEPLGTQQRGWKQAAPSSQTKKKKKQVSLSYKTNTNESPRSN